MANKVFVRGFDFGTTQQGVKDHCESAGPIQDVEFFGKGSAVVTYETEQAAEVAVATLHETKLAGNVRYIEVKMDEGKKKKSGGGTSPSSKKRKGEALNKDKVFVRGFEFDTTEEDLEAHFGTVGPITKVQWVTKGSVIITYDSTEAADKAVASLDKSIIPGKDRYMDVKIDEQNPKGSNGSKGNDMAAMKAWFLKAMMGGGYPGGGKTKSKKASGPSGPDLPRERISIAPASGKVDCWNKKWGWIRPEEKPSHAKASNHSGKIYVHVNDLVGIDSLTRGSKVTFHIYADENGLGAEEVELEE